MINPVVQDALNKQLNAEFYAAWLYLSMAGWCEENNWPGTTHWFKVQAAEETQHAMKIFNYLHDRNGTIALSEIMAPNNDWVSLPTAFEAAYAHEQSVTASINELALLAHQENDRGTVVFLDWFVMEQIEEEKSTLAILERLQSFQDNVGMMYLLDQELGKREREACGLCEE
ncbi:MAG: ferritin [Planctomycetia bacterium]|nr:ferritin [Planctomycetia bacterium]